MLMMQKFGVFEVLQGDLECQLEYVELIFFDDFDY